MEPEKRGRGRPKTRLEKPARLRCEVTEEERELVKEACEIAEEPQWQFCGKAVVARAKKVVEQRKKPK